MKYINCIGCLGIPSHPLKQPPQGVAYVVLTTRNLLFMLAAMSRLLVRVMSPKTQTLQGGLLINTRLIHATHCIPELDCAPRSLRVCDQNAEVMERNPCVNKSQAHQGGLLLYRGLV
jgi:hypothetical protein